MKKTTTTDQLVARFDELSSTKRTIERDVKQNKEDLAGNLLAIAGVRFVLDEHGNIDKIVGVDHTVSDILSGEWEIVCSHGGRRWHISEDHRGEIDCYWTYAEPLSATAEFIDGIVFNDPVQPKPYTVEDTDMPTSDGQQGNDTP